MTGEIRSISGLGAANTRFGDAGPAETDRADAPRAANELRRQAKAPPVKSGAAPPPHSSGVSFSWPMTFGIAGAGLVAYGLWQLLRK